MRYYSSRMSKKSKKTGFRKMRKPLRSKKTSFKKKVLKIVHSDQETKQAWTSFAPTFFNSGINSSGDACRLIPDITNSNYDNGRVGDQLRASKFNIRGHILFAPQGPTQSDSYRRIAARIMVVTPKTFTAYRSAIDNATTWMGYLLKKGGTTTNFSGVISDLYADINHDAITVHYDKVFYMNQPSIVAGTTSSTIPLDLSNTTKFFNININCKNKVVKYDAGVDSGLTPTNAAYILLCGYVFLDGSSPDTLSTRVQLGYSSKFYFKDA